MQTEPMNHWEDSAERSTQSPAPAVSVIVVAICSIPQLARSLSAIRAQHSVEPFEIIVAADSRLGPLDGARRQFPDVVFLSQPGRDTPLELTTMALGRARGGRIVLTEDSCIANSGWLAALTTIPAEGRAAIGGVVEATPGISPQMWAFCYVDFFRYMRPASEGESPTLSVCNVAYSRSHLESVRSLWQDGFHETEINSELKERYGPLWLNPSAEVRVHRNVTLADALYERYAFGRLFGATRIAHSPLSRRLCFAAVSPALPFLLLWRMSAKARQDPALKNQFLRAFPSILAMAAAWSWGEWLGYVSGRRPRRISTAREIQRE